jgi:hypothetical protein
LGITPSQRFEPGACDLGNSRVEFARVGQGKRSVARVARVHIGLLRDVVLYKKMKRLGIE